jgi:hypothetical protein
MKDRISIEGRDGAFDAHIARPKAVPAPAVVVLQELFGVNADIRKTCDELAEQIKAPTLNVSSATPRRRRWRKALRLNEISS